MSFYPVLYPGDPGDPVFLFATMMFKKKGRPKIFGLPF
jgi:hypothetical protein